jgi:hypothetical protein
MMLVSCHGNASDAVAQRLARRRAAGNGQVPSMSARQRDPFVPEAASRR